MTGTSDDELIVDIFEVEHLGWQLENTVLSASVFVQQVRVWSGENRSCYRIIHIGINGETISMEYPVWEKPRVDIEAELLT
jgi:hypothetical protein